MFPLKFRADVNREELGSWGYPIVMHERVTDRQMDGQTDGFTIASTALYYADAL